MHRSHDPKYHYIIDPTPARLHSTEYDPFISKTIPDTHVPPAIKHGPGVYPTQDAFHPVKSFNYARPDLVQSPFDTYEFDREWRLDTDSFEQFTPWAAGYTTRTYREVLAADPEFKDQPQHKPYGFAWARASAREAFGQGTGPLAHGLSFNTSFFQRACDRIEATWDPSTITRSIPNSPAFTAESARIPLDRYVTAYGVRSLAATLPLTPPHADSASSSSSSSSRYTVAPRSTTAPAPTPTKPSDLMQFPPCTSCGHVASASGTLLIMNRVWAALDDFLTPAECDLLPGLIQDGVIKPAMISTAQEGTVTPEIRVTDVGWIHGTEASSWLYSRLWAAVGEANHHMFHYDIQHLEPLQYSVYRADQGGHYTPHYDWGGGDAGMRKLSFSLQLSDDLEYTGGDLLLYSGETEPIPCPRKKGTIIVFPSWMLHEVTPVTQGVRKSLVGWFQGPVYF